MKRALIPGKGFVRDLKRLTKRNAALKQEVQKTLSALAEDCFQPHLHTHKLKGDRKQFYAATVAYDLRIMFELEKQKEHEVIILSAIGTHDEVY